MDKLPIVQIDANVLLLVTGLEENQIARSHLGAIDRAAPTDLLAGRARELEVERLLVKGLG
jgi:hypothetical protein